MLADPVTGIDDQCVVQVLGDVLRRAGDRVPRDNHVPVQREHAEQVQLALGRGATGPGHGGVGEPDDTAAQPGHRGLVGQPGAGAGVEEGRHQHLASQRRAEQSTPGRHVDLVRRLEQQVQVLPAELADGQDMPATESLGTWPGRRTHHHTPGLVVAVHVRESTIA